MTKTDSKGAFIAYVVVAILCAAMMGISASGKLTMNPGAVQTIHTAVGVPLSSFPGLAVCLIAGGLGLTLRLRSTRRAGARQGTQPV